MGIRLQKIIADAGLASRREAESWIEEGKVKVNDKLVTKLGSLLVRLRLDSFFTA